MSVRSRFVVLLAASLLAACGSNRAPPPAASPRALPPDSAAMLRAALELARPAYATQDEALASPLYTQGAVAQRPASRTVASKPLAPARSGPYVIQVAAFFDPEVARSAAELARHRFPDLEVIIEEAAAVLRVAVGPWATQRAAQSMLPAVRSHYPDAWVRIRASP